MRASPNKDANADEEYASRQRQDPIVMRQHRYYLPIVISSLVLTFVVGFLYNGWIGSLGGFLLASVGRTFTVLNSTFCINSICHLWGRQPHGQANSRRDSWLVSLVTFGEGYHNYHHTYLKAITAIAPAGITSIRRSGLSSPSHSLTWPRRSVPHLPSGPCVEMGSGCPATYPAPCKFFPDGRHTPGCIGVP